MDPALVHIDHCDKITESSACKTAHLHDSFRGIIVARHAMRRVFSYLIWALFESFLPCSKFFEKNATVSFDKRDWSPFAPCLCTFEWCSEGEFLIAIEWLIPEEWGDWRGRVNEKHVTLRWDGLANSKTSVALLRNRFRTCIRVKDKKGTLDGTFVLYTTLLPCNVLIAQIFHSSKFWREFITNLFYPNIQIFFEQLLLRLKFTLQCDRNFAR